LPKIVSKNFKTNREELGLTSLPTFTDMGISVLGIIATFIVAGVVVTILSNFPWFDAEQTQEIGYSTQIIGFDRVVAFLSLVVIAPIAEEIMFRGWLYGKLKKHISVPLAVFLVSALFGFIHGQLNVGVTVGIMSVIMCLERELTGTIYAGILTHMLKNGIAFYLLFIV
ncbi:CPBP family intramembrane metalloprotease, partial [Candidatus Saccharibacteria bacterium]|nr:CPBP family intramembrane metalloprotease [Candidatus Saccharibacteria bacterium]